MDIQLQELIDKIKKDGIEKSAVEAEALKAAAEAEAKRVTDAARKEAAAIAEAGRAEAERARLSGDAALAQAARNLILSLKAEVADVMGRVTARETARAMDADTLKAVIPEAVRSLCAGKEAADVLLNEKQLAELEAWAKTALAAELASGTELKAGKSLAAGFRIARKDGSAYYDFSAEAIAAALSACLNPRLAAIVNGEAGSVGSAGSTKEE